VNELKNVSISVPVNRTVQSVLIGSDKGTAHLGLFCCTLLLACRTKEEFGGGRIITVCTQI
jgi:hypothetical protein